MHKSAIILVQKKTYFSTILRLFRPVKNYFGLLEKLKTNYFGKNPQLFGQPLHITQLPACVPLFMMCKYIYVEMEKRRWRKRDEGSVHEMERCGKKMYASLVVAFSIAITTCGRSPFAARGHKIYIAI